MPRPETCHDPAIQRVSDRLRWWWLFGLLNAGAMAWALATPLFSGPDEGAHVTRAAAVARGELVGRAYHNVYGILTHVDVPEAYLTIPGSACYYARPAVSPACAPPFEGGRQLAAAPTYEFRNPPLYYALVGWPSLIWPAAPGVYLMRVVSALMWAALLASALMSALSMPGCGGGRQRPAVLGVVLAATPMVWYLGGVVNASSLEVAAAICLWASLAALVLGDRDKASGRIVARCGVAAIALVVSRGLSPAFAAMALASAAVLGPPGAAPSGVKAPCAAGLR